MSSANVTRLLHLSTGHLSMGTGLTLDNWCKSIDLTRKKEISPLDGGPPTLMAATDFGWLVYAADDYEGMPDDLIACMEYARNEDCDYILFDRDAAVDSSLPLFEDPTDAEVSAETEALTTQPDAQAGEGV